MPYSKTVSSPIIFFSTLDSKKDWPGLTFANKIFLFVGACCHFISKIPKYPKVQPKTLSTLNLFWSLFPVVKYLSHSRLMNSHDKF